MKSSGFRAARNDVDLTAAIDGCEHVWSPAAGVQRHCEAACGVVLHGDIAAAPPDHGMDWSRAVFVDPGWRGLQDRVAAANALAERSEQEAER